MMDRESNDSQPIIASSAIASSHMILDGVLKEGDSLPRFEMSRLNIGSIRSPLAYLSMTWLRRPEPSRNPPGSAAS